MEPPPGAAPGWLPLQGAPGRWTQRPRTPGETRTHTARLLMPVPPAIWLRGLRAATRCRPGPPAVRERGRSRARRQAARRGFEPRPPRPERGVLPVRRTGIGTGGAIRTRTA